MSEKNLDLEDFAAMSQISGMTTRTIGQFLTEHQDIARELQAYDPVKLAASIGSLLTKPELQSNTYRLEVLLHMVLVCARGKKKPDKPSIIRWFNRLEHGVCGRWEDPAEDVFVTSIETRRGNYRILEGIWEANGFYLQRVVNVIDAMPDGPSYAHIKQSVHALLKLSDSVCDRAELVRYQTGNEFPLETLPTNLLSSLAPYGAVRFLESELIEENIAPSALRPFCLQPEAAKNIPMEALGHTSTERFPVIYDNKCFYFILPTAVSIAIRRFIVEVLSQMEMTSHFLQALSQEYAALFSGTRIIGGHLGMPVRFQKTKKGIFSSAITSVDKGHYLGFIMVLDDLVGFENDSFSGINPDPDKYADLINFFIGQMRKEAEEKDGFRSGVILLVGCGLGRGFALHFDNPNNPNWKIEFISAPDLITLSWIQKFEPLSLFRILEAQAKLQSEGVVLENCNGLVNLVAWCQNLKGHLVPHGTLPDEFKDDTVPRMVLIEQNALLDLRAKVANDWDPHAVQNVHGQWVKIRKQRISFSEEDNSSPLYASVERDSNRWPAAVYLGQTQPWWCEIHTPEDAPGHKVFEYFRMLTVWLERIVPVIEPLLNGLPDKPVLWKTSFEEIGEISDHLQPLSFEKAINEISFEIEKDQEILLLKVSQRFENALFHPTNIAERALVYRAVEGLGLLLGQNWKEDEIKTLVNQIVIDDRARHIHAFRAKSFRDYVHSSTSEEPITVDQYDDATLRIGLGWRFRDKSEGGKIDKKEDCVSFLNRIVRELENELCSDLQKFDRTSLILKALKNHESAVADRDRWNNTAGAILSLHRNKQTALNEIINNEFKLNSVFLASRLLVEFGICECPIEGGKDPNELEFSKMMAKINIIAHLSGWSDAIEWDVMEPEVIITPLGDVFAKLDFFDNVVTPFSRATSNAKIESSIENYSQKLEEPEIRPSTVDIFDPAFQQAWKDELEFSVDEMRAFVDFVEDVAIKRQEAVIVLSRSNILDVEVAGVKLSREATLKIIKWLTLFPRTTWRTLPEGYIEKDIHPWRFRRRLSVIRKPIIQINDEEDPTLIIAPGIVRDSAFYILSHYHKGEFPDWQLQSPTMKKWAGNARGKREAFNNEVAKKLEELGWKCESNINVTKVLRKGFQDKNYGDIDVLAWNKKSNRVLVIECKDVHFKKTPGEIAEQLADFRGETNTDGKRDNLLRHLDRLDLIKEHLKEVADYTRVQGPKIEGYLVFKNLVPMQYAWQHLKERIEITTFDGLDQFKIDP